MKPVDEFERDVLLLAIVAKNMEKYDVFSFREGDEECHAYMHMKRERFEQLAQGRKVTEKDRGDKDYPIERFFVLQGIKVFAIYPAGAQKK